MPALLLEPSEDLEQELELQSPACPICQGEGSLLGKLGSLLWFRCCQCGMDFSQRAC